LELDDHPACTSWKTLRVLRFTDKDMVQVWPSHLPVMNGTSWHGVYALSLPMSKVVLAVTGYGQEQDRVPSPKRSIITSSSR
jgi:hypothetical protein